MVGNLALCKKSGGVFYLSVALILGPKSGRYELDGVESKFERYRTRRVASCVIGRLPWCVRGL